MIQFLFYLIIFHSILVVYSINDLTCSTNIPVTYIPAMKKFPFIENALNQIATLPIATWYTDRSDLNEINVQKLISKCTRTNSTLPVIVIYGLPNKDCKDGYSSNGLNKNSNDYKNFISKLSLIIQDQSIIYILEPDAMGLLEESCGKTNDYENNIRMGLDILITNNKNAKIYLDIAYWKLDCDENINKILSMIKRIDINKKLKGIALNTSNYRFTNEMKEMCEIIYNKTNYHCIIDTSRNYKGPSLQNEWCNTINTGIGHPPTNSTGYKYIDSFVWSKIPGESDGLCNQRTTDAMVGPEAGDFFLEHFIQLWNNGYYVQDLKIAEIKYINENNYKNIQEESISFNDTEIQKGNGLCKKRNLK